MRTGTARSTRVSSCPRKASAFPTTTPLALATGPTSGRPASRWSRTCGSGCRSYSCNSGPARRPFPVYIRAGSRQEGGMDEGRWCLRSSRWLIHRRPSRRPLLAERPSLGGCPLPRLRHPWWSRPPGGFIVAARCASSPATGHGVKSTVRSNGDGMPRTIPRNGDFSSGTMSFRAGPRMAPGHAGSFLPIPCVLPHPPPAAPRPCRFSSPKGKAQVGHPVAFHSTERHLLCARKFVSHGQE